MGDQGRYGIVFEAAIDDDGLDPEILQPGTDCHQGQRHRIEDTPGLVQQDLGHGRIVARRLGVVYQFEADVLQQRLDLLLDLFLVAFLEAQVEVHDPALAVDQV